MKFSESDATLYCTGCHDETLHHIRYLNGNIYSIECAICHRKNDRDINPVRELYKEVYKRVTSKPSRMTHEYKEDHNKFIVQLPKRVLSKPYRIKKYVSETKEAFKKLKDE